jgi:hypothetical protein
MGRQDEGPHGAAQLPTWGDLKSPQVSVLCSDARQRSAVQSELFLVCTPGVSLRAGVDPAKRRRLPPTAERFDQ